MMEPEHKMTAREAVARICDHMAVHKIGKYPHIKLAEALNMAISALRAQPDPSGCWLCKNEDKDPAVLGLSEVIIAEPSKYTRIGDGFEYSVPLIFCPVCGRRLPSRNTEV